MKALGSIQFGTITIKIISNSDALTVTELHFPAGAVADVHQHINEEVNYVVKGIFESDSSGQKEIYRPGDALQVPSLAAHNISCISDEDGVILTAWTPSRTDLMNKIS